MSTTLRCRSRPRPTAGRGPDADPVDEEVLGTIELAARRLPVPSQLARLVSGGEHRQTAGLHELSLLRLGEPSMRTRSPGSWGTWPPTERPTVEVEAVGGMGAISAGFDGYLYLDLADGDYLAVDFMPDPGDPRPHLLDGYHAAFRQ